MTAVHRALEHICRARIVSLDLDSPISTILGADGHDPIVPTHDSLDTVEAIMALEEEFGEDLVPAESDVSSATWLLAIRQALLGRAGTRCTWETDTILARSPRGIINERVRWRGDCTCGAERGRPTTS
jgi:hypothetical protein